MTTKVNMFCHTGVTTAQVSSGSNRFSSDSVQMLAQPYLGRESLSATASPVSSNPTNAPEHTNLVRIEVQPGHAVYVEINTPNRSVAADVGSPLISGKETFQFGPGWTISVLEASV